MVLLSELMCIRQRPSRRWVVEIEDNIQKISLWLGTFDIVEDEVACLLRGKETARMLLLRFKDAHARNKTINSNSSPNFLYDSEPNCLRNHFI